MLPRHLTLLVFTAGLVALSGCAGQQLIASTPTVEDADDQQATCKVAKDPLNPLVVEWPGTAKVDLETASRRGLVAVSYSGCTMKILSGCEIKGGYELEKTTPARDRIEISDNNELYAKLPLGAASLKGELSLGSALELDYIAVGQRVANVQPMETVGECTGATHYVRTITVGAFRLDAKAKGKAGLGVEVGPGGAGIAREESARKLRAQGEVDACVKNPDGTECGAILQLGLAPLRVVGGGKLAVGGFGKGLDPIAQVYQVRALGEIDTSGSSSLQDVDVGFLKLLQTAKRADREADLDARTKVKAWDAVAKYEGKNGNPWRERATRRAEEWTIVAEQEDRQKEALQKLKLRFLSDKQKLDELLGLDDDVVSKEQKEAYKKEFVEVYGARKEELALIGLKIKVGGLEIDGGAAKKKKKKTTSSSEDGGETKDAAEGDEPKEDELKKGLAGFGHFSIEAELGIFFSGAPTVSINGRPTAHVPDESADINTDLATGTLLDGQAKTGALMIGLMVATPELIPGGFGFYGSFRALAGGVAPDDSATQTFLSASGGIRWDPRISPKGIFTVGAGGGYFFTPETELFRECIAADSAALCTAADEPEVAAQYYDVQLGGPMVDVFAGIGYSDRQYMFAFRTWFQSVFLSHDSVEIEGPLLTGGFGGQIGLVL
ncbi:MAG: hypothetical protein IPG04_02110 [Polyangiaceae bacterium]|nr:hypothetical protein [Polyangiaceae bacterium]